MREFTEQELVRREKAQKLESLGLDPFGHRFERDSFAADIKEKYSEIEHDEFENRNDIVTIAGRIMFIRKMGKASFFSIQDKTGKMQVYMIYLKNHMNYLNQLILVISLVLKVRL